MKEYYKILGISKLANALEIKKAHRQGAMFWHPDKNHSSNAKEKFIEIQEAYEVLSNPSKRKLYDSFLNKQKRDKPQREHPKDTNSDFEKFEDWISEIRKKAEKKANIPFVDDALTESFHFLDKYGIWLIIGFVIITLLFVINL